MIRFVILWMHPINKVANLKMVMEECVNEEKSIERQAANEGGVIGPGGLAFKESYDHALLLAQIEEFRFEFASILVFHFFEKLDLDFVLTIRQQRTREPVTVLLEFGVDQGFFGLFVSCFNARCQCFSVGDHHVGLVNKSFEVTDQALIRGQCGFQVDFELRELLSVCLFT